MNVIGRKIYYDKATGNVIVDTKEHSGFVIKTTKEQDFETYVQLSERNPETVGLLELEYGQYAVDFDDVLAKKGDYRVNPETNELEFWYPDPNDPEQPPVFQRPLSEEVEELKQENILLKAQNSALTERTEFIEDVIAEMAIQVYQ